MAKQQKGRAGGSKKIGRNQVKCNLYFVEHRRIKNKRKKLEKAIRRNIRKQKNSEKTPKEIEQHIKESCVIGRRREVNNEPDDIFIKNFIEDKIICENCWRILPNKKFITKNGCLWCNSEHYLKGEKMENERKKHLLKTMKDFNKSQKNEILFFGNEIEDQKTISTGIKSIDDFLGGGIKRATHTIIWGGISTGKTSFALQTIAQAQRDGLICCYINLEKPVDNERFDMLGVNRSELIRADCTKNAEQALTIIKTLCREKVIDLIVVDSVNALSPKAEQESKKGVERGLDDKTIAELARLLSEFCRRVNPDIYNAKCGMLWIGQLRIGGIGSFYTRAVLSCGEALKFYAYQIIFTRKGQTSDAPMNSFKRYILNKDQKLSYKTEKKSAGFDSVLKLTKTNSCNSVKELEEIHLPFVGTKGYVNEFIPETGKIEISGTEEEKLIITNELVKKGILELKGVEFPDQKEIKINNDTIQITSTEGKIVEKKFTKEETNLLNKNTKEMKQEWDKDVNKKELEKSEEPKRKRGRPPKKKDKNNG